MSHPERQRLAEIIVTRNGDKSRGTGYAVAPGWVLTADHVVRDANEVVVWLGAPSRLKSGESERVSPEDILRAPPADMALIPVRRATFDNVLFGRPDPSSVEPMPYVAAGFPRFKLRPAPDDPAVQLREVHYASGRTSVGSNGKTNTLEFITALEPAEDADPKHSPWEGMSGAAVFASGTGRLIGVVGQHHRKESRRVLTVRPLTSLFEVDDIMRWQTALPQLGTSVDGLTLTTRPSERGLTEERAQRTAASLSPPVLVAREDQLDLLTSFVSGQDRWLWLQGNAFAGKTALLAWFALHQPANVDVAACFLRRTTDSANARYALDVLCRQLAVHADRGAYQPAEHLSQQREDFRYLLAEAAAASKERGRRMLLLLDGLDEDETAEPGLVIANWIPDAETLPDNALVLVASRAGVSIGLPSEHPLRQHVHDIGASPAATEIERMATVELRQALQAEGLVYDLLGLLTVANEGLTCSELTELAAQHKRVMALEVSNTLDRRLGRTILRIPHPDGLDELVLVFAHASLLDRARADYAADLPTLRRRVVEWCHEWASRAPIADLVPSYVTRHYADQLAAQRDWSDRWNDLLTPSWAALRERDPASYLPYRSDLHQLLRTSHVVNEAAVSSHRDGPAIPSAVTAIAAKAALESQFQATTPELVAVMVETGRWSSPRALQYLASITNEDERARAMGSIAPVLDPSASADLFKVYYGLGEDSDERGMAALGVARLLVAAGRGVQASEFAASEALAERPCAACHAAAGALRGLPHDDAARMLSLVAQWAPALGDGYGLWHFVERLSRCLSRDEAVLLPIGQDPGLYLLDILGVPDDDLQNSAEALRLAASWMDERLLQQHCQALLDWAQEDADSRDVDNFANYLESEVLAVLSSVAPPAVRLRILRRCAELGDKHKLQTVAGLLAVDDGSLAPTLLRELSPHLTPLTSVGGLDDRSGVLALLAQSGHGSLAVDYLEATVAVGSGSYELDGYIEAVAPHLDLDELRRLREFASQRDSTLHGGALGDIAAWIARRSGDSPSTTISKGPMSVDAGQLARLSMTGQLPLSNALPIDRSLRLVAALVAVQDGKVGLRDALRAMADPPSPFAASLLPEMVGLLPIDEGGEDDLIDFCLPRGPRVVEAVLRAIAANSPDPIERLTAELFSSDDPVLKAQILSVYGPQLINSGVDVSELASGASNDGVGVMYRAAVTGENGLDAIADELHALSPFLQLRVIEAVPAPLRSALVSRLSDSYITGSGTKVTEIWARQGLPLLIRSMDARQLAVVESAIAWPKGQPLSGTVVSMLHAEMAVRWAQLGDFSTFRIAIGQISRTDDVARALAAAVLEVPLHWLADWFELVEQRVVWPHWLEERVLIWPFARSRWRSTDIEIAWEVCHQWMSRADTNGRAAFDQPWQVLVDLVGYGSALTKLGGPGTGERLCELLTAAGLLSADA